MPLQWLKPIKNEKGEPILKPNGSFKYRRTLAEKGKRVEPEQILKWLKKKHWKYAWTPDFYKLRDKALISLLFLCCGRVGEVLALKREQFKMLKDFVIIHDYKVEKNKENPYRDDWACPRRGRLAPFTKIVLEYLEALPKERSKLFLIKRARAHQLVKYITGKWPHWFRSMAEAYFMRNVFFDPVKFASALKLRRSDTLIQYVPHVWRDYEKELLT